MNDKNLEFMRGLDKLKASPVKAEDYISPLEQDKMLFKGETPKPQVSTTIKNVTENINTKVPTNVISGANFQDKIKSLLDARKLAKTAKNTLKSVPLVGTAVGLGSMLLGNDASAATPIFNEVEDVGPNKGTLEWKLENGEPLTEEERNSLNQRMQMLQSIPSRSN